jgi:hypothetical protein
MIEKVLGSLLMKEIMTALLMTTLNMTNLMILNLDQLSWNLVVKLMRRKKSLVKVTQIVLKEVS